MLHTHQASNFHYCPHGQRGAALMIMLVIMVVGASTVLVSSLNSSGLRIERDKITADALAQAKGALIGYAVSQPITSAGDLRLPDLGFSNSLLTVPAEGSSPPNFTGNTQGYSIIGKFPWKTLGTPPLRDGYGECLWYALSGWLKNTNSTSPINWDTPGQIDVLDGNGNVIASNLAALVAAPGPVLDGQNRSLGDTIYTQCGGNYDVLNYLDTYDSTNAVSGEVNYFSGSTNNRIAADTNSKRLVMANTDYYNDTFLFITVDDIFRPIIRRSDFSAQIAAMMNDAAFITHLQSITVSGLGTKGTGNVNCTNAPNQAFCTDWQEMLLLTALTPPSPITIDGTLTTTCSRVLIFGGQKIAAQVRMTAAQKSNPAYYLEDPNLAAFAVPTTTSSDFTGAPTFDANTPSADLLKCIP